MKGKILKNLRELQEKNALICNNEVFSYEKLNEIIDEKLLWYKNNCAEYIVGVAAGNILEVVILLLLSLFTNGKIVLLGDCLRKKELEEYIEKLGIQILFIPSSKKEEYEMGNKKSFDLFGKLECIFFEKNNINEVNYKDSDYIVQITSGSEGVSKAAARSQKSLKEEISGICKMINFNEDLVFMTIPPIYHSYGLVLGVLLPLYLGKTVILVEKFDPDFVEKALINRGVNVLLAVPFMYHVLCRRLNREKKNNLSKCFSAGGILDDNLKRKFFDIMNIEIWNDYGSTETGTICIDIEGIPGSVGKPIQSKEIIILDQKGNRVNQDKEGTVYIKQQECHYVWPTYLNDSKFYKGLYCTGDRGKKDIQGRLYLYGREDDILIIGGEKTSAKEIEEVILRRDGVNEVVVLAEKNPIIGDIVCAYIVLEKDKDISELEIIDHCLKNMEQYKIPKKIFFVDEIPKNKNGKILKKYLINL